MYNYYMFTSIILRVQCIILLRSHSRYSEYRVQWPSNASNATVRRKRLTTTCGAAKCPSMYSTSVCVRLFFRREQRAVVIKLYTILFVIICTYPSPLCVSTYIIILHVCHSWVTSRILFYYVWLYILILSS